MNNFSLVALFLLCVVAHGQNAGQSHNIEVASSDCRNYVQESVDGLTPPQVTYCPEPAYPPRERKAKHEGAVGVALQVDKDGVTHDIAVAHSLSPDFDAAALEAVNKWRFTHATRDGKPVRARIEVRVEFHLFNPNLR